MSIFQVRYLFSLIIDAFIKINIIFYCKKVRKKNFEKSKWGEQRTEREKQKKSRRLWKTLIVFLFFHYSSQYVLHIKSLYINAKEAHIHLSYTTLFPFNSKKYIYTHIHIHQTRTLMGFHYLFSPRVQVMHILTTPLQNEK